MNKLIFAAAIAALLSACSSMSGSGMSDGSGMSRSSTMGNSAYIGSGRGPSGASGGGPN